MPWLAIDRAYYETKFLGWLKEHNIEARDGEHFAHMLQNFANNDDIIEAHNAQKHPYTLAHNQFSHMNREEWSAYVSKGLSRPIITADSVQGASTGYPASVDWVAAGAVTPVKDQGSCGSCWSFSTTGALEGVYQIKTGSLQSFSEQNLVDCDCTSGTPVGVDKGCNGGLLDHAFNWVKRNQGIALEADYPYVSGTTKTSGPCATTKPKFPIIVTNYTDIAVNNNDAFKTGLALNPVSIAIQANQPAFQLYKSGVFNGTCGANLDHGVLAVGYGTDSASGLPFYNVKNSWGTTWGENGYIRLIDNATLNNGAGQCGILSDPSYPLL